MPCQVGSYCLLSPRTRPGPSAPPVILFCFPLTLASCLRVSLFEVGKKEQQMVVAVSLATYCLPQHLPSAPASSLYEQGFELESVPFFEESEGATRERLTPTLGAPMWSQHVYVSYPISPSKQSCQGYCFPFILPLWEMKPSKVRSQGKRRMLDLS